MERGAMINLPDGTDSYYTTREVCSVLHCHKSTLAKWKRWSLRAEIWCRIRVRLF
jgi:hypothetical protein